MKKFLKNFIFDWIKTETIYSYLPVALIVLLSCLSYSFFPEHWGKLTLLSIVMVILGVWKLAKHLEK
ncbi:hypothetical protein M976_00590 [Buttiauxella ferragutiae ATCC 51602]|jgi:multidrug transporter EmrE-like cation transporter|uniref:Uncharacterized protein n=1 Tax=Buttiauxella ferragutiae ATCC 51602 TaxID=1354252 RepID=A0ABX2WCQ6_9ENTR|nr:hypothetical protein M976_00590 [Buttiauxella ferragutiae ATCC 51602]